jgi:Nuclease-related domain
MYDHPPDHPDLPWTGGQVVYRGAGLTVRAYTADQLRARLAGPHPAAPALPAAAPAEPWPAPVAAPVAPGGNRAGASARAEYRRRRAAELARWSAGLPWRAALVAITGLAASQLAAHATLSRPWLAGLLAAAGAAWQLRFRPSQPTRAWREGARGERATARRLHRLERGGYRVLHDLEVPGSHANLDHVAIGPAGVFVIDSKRYRGRLHLAPDGMLWYGGLSAGPAAGHRRVGDHAAGRHSPASPRGARPAAHGHPPRCRSLGWADGGRSPGHPPKQPGRGARP